MGDAAASKILHLMQPALFVMWDRYVKPYAAGYGDFMRLMHGLTCKLMESAPQEAAPDVEGFLQARLHYPMRKTLAKYLDEYNWYVAFGATRALP